MIAVIAGLAWMRSQAPGQGGEARTVGQQVQRFELPSLTSGQMFSMADYLGKKEIVVVGYMGFFCVGCFELMVELEGRQAEFQDRGAVLVGLGSLPESQEFQKSKAAELHLTYPLLYDANTKVTKSLDLWSDHMQMPWMGYLVIDKSGKVASSDLQLSEAKGAAPANVDSILQALDRVQAAAVRSE